MDDRAITTISSLNISSTNQAVDPCEDFWLTGAIKVSEPEDVIRYIHWAFLRPPIDTLGILGNCALLLVLRRPKFKSRTYSYIFWLAIADLGTLVFDALFLLTTVERYHRSFGHEISWTLCHFLFPVYNSLGAWSAFMVVILTIHRLRAVWDPFAFRIQTSRSYLVALAALLISLLINVVGYFQYSILWVTKKREEGVAPEIRCYACTWSKFHREAVIQDGYIYGRELVLRVIPLVAVFVLNIVIIIVYRRRQAQGRVLRSASGQPDPEEHRVVYMLLFIGTFYVISMTPITLFLVALSTKRTDTTSINFELFRVAANVLAISQTASNSYLYFFCSRTVRGELFQLCKGVFRTIRSLRLSSSERFRRTRPKTSQDDAMTMS